MILRKTAAAFKYLEERLSFFSTNLLHHNVAAERVDDMFAVRMDEQRVRNITCERRWQRNRWQSPAAGARKTFVREKPG
jgi:hypothetical protein